MRLILSIAGGGIRGIIPAVILAELERRTGRPIAESFDLIAGTSTGGIIAAMLAVPGESGKPKYTADMVVDMYKEFGKEVFNRNFLRKVLTANGLLSTKYNCKTIEKLLKKYLGDVSLSHSVTNLLIPSYKINGTPSPYFFKTMHASNPRCTSDNPCLWQCARATSAANGYFKPFKLGKDLTLLDGGVFANNPAMCAYAQAKNTYGSKEEIVIISVETGTELLGYSYEQIEHWGMVQWALPFFKQTSISSSESIHYMLRTLSANGDKYIRFQSHLDEDSVRMDNAGDENILRLEQIAWHTIEKCSDILDDCAAIIIKQYYNRG